MKRALVLAAGRGSRLGDLTNDLPKTMLDVHGRSILATTLSHLRDTGHDDIWVLGGWQFATLESHVAELEISMGITVSLRENARYETLNNCYSLWMCADLLEPGCTVVNGDAYLPQDYFESLANDTSLDRVTLGIDAHCVLTEESMKVEWRNDVCILEKPMPVTASLGEYVGLHHIGADVAGPLADALKSTWERDANTYYEDGITEFSRRGGQVQLHMLPPGNWVEVDDRQDLDAARSIVNHNRPA